MRLTAICLAAAALLMARGAAAEPAFSIQELAAAGPVAVPKPLTLGASDGTLLALRAYVPAEPSAVLVFLHGGGAHSAAGYQHLGHGLERAGIAVYTPDLRGHGASGGGRGDAPSKERVWRDLRETIEWAERRHPGLPVFAGGHSSGAGVVLNYAGWDERREVAGYAMVSPQLGYQSGTARPASGDGPGFASVSVTPFVVNAMTGGFALGHYPAVRFHYPDAALDADPAIVTAYTVNMANAVTPQRPEEQFAALDRPFGLWIGAEDELFVADKVVAYAALADQPGVEARVLPRARHLSILLAVHEPLGDWLKEQSRR